MTVKWPWPAQYRLKQIVDAQHAQAVEQVREEWSAVPEPENANA